MSHAARFDLGDTDVASNSIIDGYEKEDIYSNSDTIHYMQCGGAT